MSRDGTDGGQGVRRPQRSPTLQRRLKSAGHGTRCRGPSGSRRRVVHNLTLSSAVLPHLCNAPTPLERFICIPSDPDVGSRPSSRRVSDPEPLLPLHPVPTTPPTPTPGPCHETSSSPTTPYSTTGPTVRPPSLPPPLFDPGTYRKTSPSPTTPTRDLPLTHHPYLTPGSVRRRPPLLPPLDV